MARVGEAGATVRLGDTTAVLPYRLHTFVGLGVGARGLVHRDGDA